MKNWKANVLRFSIFALSLTPAIAQTKVQEAIWEPVPPGMKTQNTVKLTPEQELATWMADCTRKIRRQFSENSFVKETTFSVKFSENGTKTAIAVVKTENETIAKDAISVLEQAIKTFHRAPNDLPYKQTLVVEFLTYPTIRVILK